MPLRRHDTPEEDDINSKLVVASVEIDGDWTSVTFHRYVSELDDQVK